ncbi:MAG: transporter substrate-binding domain-containing protein [Desulfobacteraceae bacterium]
MKGHMSKTKVIIILVLTIFFSSAHLSPSVAGENTPSNPSSTVLKSASELDYPPFALVRDNGSADGFSVDLLKAVVATMGRNIHFKVGPWHEIKQQLINRDLNVLPLVSYTVDRDDLLDFTAPFIRLHGTVFVRKDNSSINSFRDLKGKGFYEQKFCFAVPEGDKKLLALLNEGLAIVIANGTYNELYDKWFGPILPRPQVGWAQILKYLFSILVPLLFLAAVLAVWYLRREVANKTNYLQKEIQERKQVERSLKKSLADLEKSNAELEQFAYVASHDLQEPLRAVIGFLQLLQSKYQGQLDEKGQHYIERAVKAGHRMQSLIGDLLKVSRVNTLDSSFEPADLTKVLEEVLEHLQSTITEKNGVVTYSRLPTLTVDRHQIQSLFQNLIANSLKYNDHTQPTIEIGYEDKGHVTCFFIKDNGIGIAEEYHGKVFMIFQRLHARQAYSGSGIGLALCKKIVERHQGNIWVESESGKGATFYFTLAGKKENR